MKMLLCCDSGSPVNAFWGARPLWLVISACFSWLCWVIISFCQFSQIKPLAFLGNFGLILGARIAKSASSASSLCVCTAVQEHGWVPGLSVCLWWLFCD